MRRHFGTFAAIALGLGVLAGAAQAHHTATFHSRLTGHQEVSPVDTRASGVAVLKVAPSGVKMDVKVNVANIRDVVAAHLHLAPPGENGPVVVTLYGPADPGGREKGQLTCKTVTKGDLSGPLAGQPLSALVNEIKNGNIYVNVHTVAHPTGEIRGQVGTSRSSRR